MNISNGKTIALVLGAGGARGLAHIGVIEVLVEHGYRIAAISGSSMGALVGGIHAAGRLRQYRDWAYTLERGSILRLLDLTFGSAGLLRGERVIGALREMVGEFQIEHLSIPFTAVATDLATQREVWLTRGPLFDAIRASIAIPMIFTPHLVDGRELVDGGLLAPVPIAPTRNYHVDKVIAVDVNSKLPMYLPEPHPRSEAALPEAEMFNDEDQERGLIDKMRAWFSNSAAEEDLLEKKTNPGFMELMSQSLDTMQSHMARLQLAMDPPDVLIQVPRDSAMFYEYWRARELVEVGRKAAEQALTALK